MKKLLITAAAALAVVSFAPTFSNAQGFAVDTPVGGVRVGTPGYHHYNRGYNRGYNRRYHRGPYVERRMYRERNVGLGCRTVTIRNDNGFVKRIRKCG